MKGEVDSHQDCSVNATETKLLRLDCHVPLIFPRQVGLLHAKQSMPLEAANQASALCFCGQLVHVTQRQTDELMSCQTPAMETASKMSRSAELPSVSPA